MKSFRLFIVAALLALSASAYALTPNRLEVLFSGGCPFKAGAVCANVDLNFAGGTAFVLGIGNVPFTQLLSVTRAGVNATNLLPTSPSGFAYTTYGANTLRIDSNGLLIEEARTNQLLNSTAPATQTTGALAATPQTLWVNGSGSATLSNGTATGCAGVATQGTPVTFTPTAGTCVVTKAGSLNAFQLEAGAFGTSLIVTTGATVTRAADNITAAGLLLSTIITGRYSAYFGFNIATAPASQARILTTNLNDGFTIKSNRTIATLVGNTLKAASVNTFTLATNVNGAGSGNASGTTVVLSGGTVATDVTAFGTTATSVVIGNRAALDIALNGYLRRLAVSSNANGAFNALTTP